MVKNFTDVMTRRILRMSKVVSGALLAHDTLVLTFFFVRNFCCEKSRSFKTVVFNGVAERKPLAGKEAANKNKEKTWLGKSWTDTSAYPSRVLSCPPQNAPHKLPRTCW